MTVDELIQEGARRTGIDEARVRQALTAALGLLDRHAERSKLGELYAAVGGAEALATSPEARPRGGGGLFGGLMKSAGGVSGAAISDAMGALDRLKKAGVAKSDLKALLPVAEDKVREETGRDLLRDVVASVPGVGPLLGGR
jgi:hypothetical protein